MNNRIKLLLLVLLVKPAPGFGQQQPATRFESLVAAAQQAQAANDFAAAVNDYRQAVRIEPDMPELWANLGLMEQQAGDISGALESFLHANRLNPSLYVPNLFLGNDYLRTGKAPQAISFLTKAEKINKTDPQAPLALGRAYYAVGKFTAAAQEFGRAIALDPKLGAAWFALGIAHLNQVEVDARKMSIEDKSSPFAGALYAESLEKQARFSEAASLYRSLLASQPQPPCMQSELGFSLLRHRDFAGAATEFASERSAHPECGLALVGQARIAIDHGDNEQAVKLLQELWGRDHGFFAFNAAILMEGVSNEAASAAVAFFSQPETIIPGDFRDALLAALNRGRQTLENQHQNADPGKAGAPVAAVGVSADRRSAEDYYAAGEFERCAQRINPALAAGRADKLRLLAACSFFAGDNERAFGAATALGALQPHSAEALYWSIQANERLALQSLAQFQQLEPDSARSHVLLGDIYHQLEREDDAQAEYQKALDLEPGNPAAMLGLALAYLSNNNMDKAMETARTALQVSPQDPELNMVVAEAMVVRNQFAEAEPYLMKSLNVKPQLVGHVHALIGKVYAETGRTSDAISQLKMGESSDENGSIHYLLARLYRQIGDTKDAAAALDQMKTIKQQRRDRGVKTVEDPDLSSLESPPGEPTMP
ncbi:MAG TPA: tetratricopeptide repeat protein [Terracidiphilus sp.]|nr:tetratricopeptide repeat protein [Terracidiphilus sp.]